MAVAPHQHHSASNPVLPWIPLPAILGFALLGVGGSIVLTYTTFSYAETKRPAPLSDNAHVYEARAVPFDSLREDPAQRASSISRALIATQAEVRRAETGEPEHRPAVSQPTLLADADRELRGFPGFAHSSGANTYLTISGSTLGISPRGLPGGFVAPDAEVATGAPVPEVSTWLCGAVLFLLIAARGVRARLHRNRRR